MKANVLMYIGLILIILQVAILANVTAKSSYAESIRQSLDDSLERSMSLIRTDAEGHFQLYDLDDEVYGAVNVSNADKLGEFKTGFISILAKDLDPKIENLVVNIYGADEETGILSVEVVADFMYLDGRHKGTVSSYKTMIINKTLKDATDAAPTPP